MTEQEQIGGNSTVAAAALGDELSETEERLLKALERVRADREIARQAADSMFADANEQRNRAETAETALAQAQERIATLVEDCAKVADAVAQDDGERAARGYFTTEEQARRGAGRTIAASIRALSPATGNGGESRTQIDPDPIMRAIDIG